MPPGNPRPSLDLGADFRRALDPVELARDCGVEPDAWQAGVLRSEARKQLLLCSRQSGKSTTVALRALHAALYAAPAMVLMVSPSQRQSGELFRKLVTYWRELPGAVEAEQESLTSLRLKNGSRVISLPGTEATVRGYSGATLILLDEAARVADDLIAALRPSLATTGGQMIALSTPAGMRGWFYETWQTGQDWERVKITASDCPRISQDFLDDERKNLGEHTFGQEYLCEFYEPVMAVFGADLIERAFTDAFEPFFAAA